MPLWCAVIRLDSTASDNTARHCQEKVRIRPLLFSVAWNRSADGPVRAVTLPRSRLRQRGGPCQTRTGLAVPPGPSLTGTPPAARRRAECPNHGHARPKATVGSHSRWLLYGGQQGATALRPSTPPESGEHWKISLTALPARGRQRSPVMTYPAGRSGQSWPDVTSPPQVSASARLAGRRDEGSLSRRSVPGIIGFGRVRCVRYSLAVTGWHGFP